MTSWVAFYQDVFGPHGLLLTSLTTEQLEAYQRSDDYAELNELLADLRSTDREKPSTYESEQMITIRIPRSLHAVLADESEDTGLSLQKLCITKLLQPSDARYLPIQQGKLRGRRIKKKIVAHQSWKA